MNFVCDPNLPFVELVFLMAKFSLAALVVIAAVVIPLLGAFALYVFNLERKGNGRKS